MIIIIIILISSNKNDDGDDDDDDDDDDDEGPLAKIFLKTQEPRWRQQEFGRFSIKLKKSIFRLIKLIQFNVGKSRTK